MRDDPNEHAPREGEADHCQVTGSSSEGSCRVHGAGVAELPFDDVLTNRRRDVPGRVASIFVCLCVGPTVGGITVVASRAALINA